MHPIFIFPSTCSLHSTQGHTRCTIRFSVCTKEHGSPLPPGFEHPCCLKFPRRLDQVFRKGLGRLTRIPPQSPFRPHPCQTVPALRQADTPPAFIPGFPKCFFYYQTHSLVRGSSLSFFMGPKYISMFFLLRRFMRDTFVWLWTNNGALVLGGFFNKFSFFFFLDHGGVFLKDVNNVFSSGCACDLSCVSRSHRALVEQFSL